MDVSKKPKKAYNRFLANFYIIIGSAVILFVLFNYIPGYKWALNNLVIGNIKVMVKNPRLSVEQKWAIKCGFDYRYLNYIKQNTPENAVILMPSESEVHPKGQKSDFNTSSLSITNKAVATYFLYPRKLVYKKGEENNPYSDKVDFVAIVNHFGYDELNYNVKKKVKYAILPKNPVQN